MILSTLLADEPISPLGDLSISISGITADSRKVQPGYVFAAISGSKLDGRAFIAMAVEQGAAAILVQDDLDMRGVAGNVPLIRVKNIHQSFARMVARFYAPQPPYIIAVTGTNGKTSVTTFLRQIWEFAGLHAANIGTVGVTTKDGTRSLGLTTPDPILLHSTLQELLHKGITHVAMEASSHGLDQHRLDGVKFSAGAFTNLTRDHLDYHHTFEAYRAAKLRLFTEVLPPNAPAVVDVDSEEGRLIAQLSQIAGHEVFSVGRTGTYIQLIDVQTQGFSQKLSLAGSWGRAEVALPLAGGFQVQNALVAAGLALISGVSVAHVFGALEKLTGAPGRLEPCGITPKGAAVFVDYAHTPDALENAISALRPYCSGKLIVVFGCGGDRDPGKRPLMGEVASRLADIVIVTDDNPRSEVPEVIRAEILEAAPLAQEIADRAHAIRTALEIAQQGDIVLVAGKGHETGQIFGDKTLPFSDHQVIEEMK